MKPALTAEEWAEKEYFDDTRNRMGKVNLSCYSGLANIIYVREDDWYEPQEISLRRLDAFAAFALHNQPFGFTREDVGLLQALSERCYAEPTATGAGMVLDELADRIESLLPPEEPKDA